MESAKFNIQTDENTLKTPVRCLIWGSGTAFNDSYQTIKYYESSGKIQVYGITSNASLYSELGGYRFISKDKIDLSSFDVVIVMAYSDDLTNEIVKEASNLGVEDRNIIPCRVIRLMGFDFDKYRKIKSDPPSIFATNCWGGLTYHQLGLRFDSPFINMFLTRPDYLKFLENPKYYMSCELKFKQISYDDFLKRDFPVAECGDILLNFNHYNSFDEANECWIKRKKRIKWDNLFVMFYDENISLIERFCELPYQKKICFTPFETGLDNTLCVNYRINEEMRQKPFWKIVNGMANGRWPYYDVLDLLLYNRITPLAKLSGQ